jgi:RNA polymerase sigma-70 factor (ECF subfamily)
MDLFQQFALKFLRGDFRRADPERGRFRDYIKVTLVHMVNDFHRQRRAAPGRLPEQIADPHQSSDEDNDDLFRTSWRDELIQRAWDAMRRHNESYYAALLFHSQAPDAPSSEIAAQISRQVGRPISDGNARVLLHRAREQFAKLLREEVLVSLGVESPPEALHAELRDLGLLSLCDPPQ